MAIQLAAALMPVIKKVGMEVATEVAYKMVNKELERQKGHLCGKVETLSTDADSVRGGKKVKLLGKRIASEALESKALNTGMGAVLGAMTTAASASIRKTEDKGVFGKQQDSARKAPKENAARKNMNRQKPQDETVHRKFGR